MTRAPRGAPVAVEGEAEPVEVSDDDSSSSSAGSADEGILASASAATAAADGEGEIRHGPGLHPHVRGAVDAARRAPPRFSSLRRSVAAGPAELRLAEVWIHDDPPKPRRAGRADGEPHPDALYPPDLPFGGPMPPRPIRFRQLFLEGGGGYEELADWWRLAEAAMPALARGEHVTVPVLVIPQAKLAQFARKLIWDTSDPDDCWLQRASTADTTEPGPQLRRDVFRAAAASLGRDAEDIVRQGGGGIEALSITSLDSVFAIHHNGVAEHYSAAAAAVDKELASHFTSDSFPHSPCWP